MQNKNIMDLFAGCGGMSLGFELAGFKSLVAVEKDDWASETYAYNHPGTKVFTGDITQIKDPGKAFPEAKVVAGIVGGPPCQGFSLSGARDPKNPRNSLFMDYMRFVENIKPLFFIMENVPGILSAKTRNGGLVQEVIKSVATGIGYNVHQMVLNAANYGVPQSRMRVFFVGIRKDYPFDPGRLIPIPLKTPQVTIREALSDLPVLKAGEGEDFMDYATEPVNEYQKWCRQNSGKVQKPYRNETYQASN